MDKLLTKHNILKMIPEEIKNLDGHISFKEIEFIIENLLTKKILSPEVSLGNSIKNLRKM